MSPDEGGDRYSIKSRTLEKSNTAHTIVSSFEPDKKAGGKDGPIGTDIVTETITTTNTYSVEIYDSETETTFTGSQSEVTTSVTTVSVNGQGEIGKIENSFSSSATSFGIGAGGVCQQTTEMAEPTKTIGKKGSRICARKCGAICSRYKNLHRF